MKTNNLFFNAGSVFLILSFILTLTFLNAQSYCSTPATMRQIEKRPIISEMPFNLNHYCLKVYFHVIQTSSGVGDQTQQTVEQAFQILSEDFAPHNISFSGMDILILCLMKSQVQLLNLFNLENNLYLISIIIQMELIFIYSAIIICGVWSQMVLQPGELLLAGKILGQSVTLLM